MNRRQAENWNRTQDRLMTLGMERSDIEALFRIERTLQRWAEKECGDGNDYQSWAIERDEATDKPYMVIHPHSGKSYRYAIADKEKGAMQRLGRIMAKYPALRSYHQTDPRGCALYILKAEDCKADKTETDYTRGVAVCY